MESYGQALARSHDPSIQHVLSSSNHTSGVAPDWLIVVRLAFSASHLPSRSAAPPSMTVLTKMPSFSKPASAPTPIPMMLMPRPSSSVRELKNRES